MLNIAIRLVVFAAVFGVIWGIVGIWTRWQDWSSEGRRLAQSGTTATAPESVAHQKSRTILLASGAGLIVFGALVFFVLVPWGVRFLAQRGVACFT